MARKPKNTITLVRPDHWDISDTLEIERNGSTILLEVDTVIGISGERGGRFRFKEHVMDTKTGNEWITVCGGTAQGTPRETIMFRSFRPERITRTYRPIRRRKR